MPGTRMLLQLMAGVFTQCMTILISMLIKRRKLRRALSVAHFRLTSINKRKIKRKSSNRKYWIRPGRTGLWFNNFLDDKVAEEEWLENFRMRKQCFYTLCNLLENDLQNQTTAFRQPIPVKETGWDVFVLYS